MMLMFNIYSYILSINHQLTIKLFQHACDHKRWKSASQERMEVLSPAHVPINRTKSMMTRTRSKLVLMYNETKI